MGPAAIWGASAAAGGGEKVSLPLPVGPQLAVRSFRVYVRRTIPCCVSRRPYGGAVSACGDRGRDLSPSPAVLVP